MIFKSSLGKRIFAALLVVGLMAGSALAASAVTVKTIEANYMGIKIVIDGVEITPTDAGGNVVEPFISEGTTYLPVRAVGNAFGKEVSWDGETKTVYIGKIPGQETNWMRDLPPYQVDSKVALYNGSDPKRTFSVAGNVYTTGVLMRAYSREPSFAIWNTNAQYSSMTFTIGHSGNDTWDGKLEVYLDGEYSTEYELKYDAAPKTITVPLNYAPNVKLVLSCGTGSFGLYDISFS